MRLNKLLLFILLICLSSSAYSQAPSSFNYQAIIRDAEGNIKSEQQLNLGISITDNESTELFTESHSVKTNKNGMVSLAIGSVSNGLDSIDWSGGPFFISISIDGNNLGSSQLLSVPFSMYSNKAKYAENVSTASYSDNVFVENSFENTNITINTISQDNNYQGSIVVEKDGIYAHESNTTEKIVSPVKELESLDFYKISLNFTGWNDLLIANTIANSPNFADNGLAGLSKATIGFWLDLSAFTEQGVFITFKDNNNSILEEVKIQDLTLNYSISSANGNLTVKDQAGSMVYIQLTSDISYGGLYLILRSRGEWTGNRNIIVGGVSYVLDDMELNPRVKYTTRKDKDFPYVRGKKVCFVGDSTTAGMALIYSFMYYTGASYIVNASIPGASIANPAQASGNHAGNWIYNFKEFVVSNNPDAIIYNISSNDTYYNTGTKADINNTNNNFKSYYKWYYKMIEFVMTNTTSVLGSGVQNLAGANKYHLLSGWYTNTGNSGDNGGKPRREVAIDMKKVVQDISDYWCCDYLDIQKATGARVENNLEGDGIHPAKFIHAKTAYLQAKKVNDYFVSNKE